jgi:hypothetical protein
MVCGDVVGPTDGSARVQNNVEFGMRRDFRIDRARHLDRGVRSSQADSLG